MNLCRTPPVIKICDWGPWAVSKEWDVDEVCQQHCSVCVPFQSVVKGEDGPPPQLLPRRFALFSWKIAESNDNDMPGMMLYSVSLNETPPPPPPTSQRGKCSSKLHQKLP